MKKLSRPTLLAVALYAGLWAMLVPTLLALAPIFVATPAEAQAGVPFPINAPSNPAQAGSMLCGTASVQQAAYCGAASNTQLAALPIGNLPAGSMVVRYGIQAGGDSLPVLMILLHSACNNSGAGDGGGNIPAATSGWCWQIAQGIKISPLFWERFTDIGTAATNTAAWLAAMNYQCLAPTQPTTKGADLDLAAGHWKLTGTVVWPCALNLWGRGKGATFIDQTTANVSTMVIEPQPTANLPAQDVCNATFPLDGAGIHHLTLNGNAGNNQNAGAMAEAHRVVLLLDDVEITGNIYQGFAAYAVVNSATANVRVDANTNAALQTGASGIMSTVQIVADNVSGAVHDPNTDITVNVTTTMGSTVATVTSNTGLAQCMTPSGNAAIPADDYLTVTPGSTTINLKAAATATGTNSTVFQRWTLESETIQMTNTVVTTARHGLQYCFDMQAIDGWHGRSNYGGWCETAIVHYKLAQANQGLNDIDINLMQDHPGHWESASVASYGIMFEHNTAFTETTIGVHVYMQGENGGPHNNCLYEDPALPVGFLHDVKIEMRSCNNAGQDGVYIAAAAWNQKISGGFSNNGTKGAGYADIRVDTSAGAGATGTLTTTGGSASATMTGITGSPVAAMVFAANANLQSDSYIVTYTAGSPATVVLSKPAIASNTFSATLYAPGTQNLMLDVIAAGGAAGSGGADIALAMKGANLGTTITGAGAGHSVQEILNQNVVGGIKRDGYAAITAPCLSVAQDPLPVDLTCNNIIVTGNTAFANIQDSAAAGVGRSNGDPGKIVGMWFTGTPTINTGGNIGLTNGAAYAVSGSQPWFVAKTINSNAGSLDWVELGRGSFSAPPNGSAGGDLGGTFPSPTVTNLSHVTNASLPNTGLVNAAMTIAGHSVALGGTQAIAAADLSNGVTGSGAIVLAGSPTLTGTLTVPQAIHGGTISAAYGTNGIQLINTAATTITDSSSTGTVTNYYANVLGVETLAASNSGVTYTNAATLQLGTPAAGANVTITNPYSLIAAGNVRITGNLNTGGSAVPTAQLQVGGAVSVAAWGTNGARIATNNVTYTDNNSPTGTVTNMYIDAINTSTIAASNVSVVYTNACTVCIKNAPLAGSNVSFTNAWALDVIAGNTNVQALYAGGSQIADTSADLFSPGYLAITGTTLPSTAAGKIAIGGEATKPTMSANGEGAVYLTSTTGGLTLMGKGSSTDITLINAAGTTALSLATGTTNWTVAGGLTVSGATTGSVSTAACWTSGLLLITDAANCITSSKRFKHLIADLGFAFTDLLTLHPVGFNRLPETCLKGDPNCLSRQLGFIAEEVCAIDARACVYEPDGKTIRAYRPEAITAIVVRALHDVVWGGGLLIVLLIVSNGMAWLVIGHLRRRERDFERRLAALEK